MHAALALAERGRGRTAPNPTVGCVIVNHGKVVGRGWTQPGGRPHAEAMALAEAGDAARGATVYTTLEPCAHESLRGPACSDLLIAAGVARVVAALGDPDPRTDGRGHGRLRAAGIAVETGLRADDARWSMTGFLTRQRLGRPHVTLKLATSLDGCIARANGESKWITGAPARAHAHVERARHEAILVGRGTNEADAPTLDVRLAGLEDHGPRRFLLTRHPRESGGPSPTRASRVHGEELDPHLRGDDGWEMVGAPDQIATLDQIDHLLVEGGAQTASAFLADDLVDRLLLYRAPILIGGGKPAIADIGLTNLADAHGRWRLRDRRMLGIDCLEEYERIRA
jgi:diaminohydroxyphosphoribosylaminopyrimidine deaminase/5-amino-6-(5-phosphoribosylamino)uracil reductase